MCQSLLKGIHPCLRVYTPYNYMGVLKKSLINRSGLDEIAAPDKVISVSTTNFVPRIVQGNFYFVATFSDYYILTDCVSMFDSNIKKDFEWLKSYWNCLALITTNTTNNYPTVRCDHADLPSLLDNRCYTIVNGLTIYLAYHRARKIRARDALPVLQNFVATFSQSPLQPVTVAWEHLYYGKNVPNIADLPWYYTCMGPQWADPRICRLFYTDSFVYHSTNASILYASPRNAMYPYFNPDIYNLDPDQDVPLDPETMLTAVTRTKRSMKYASMLYTSTPTAINTDVYKLIKAYSKLYICAPARLTKIVRMLLKPSMANDILNLVRDNVDVPIPILKHVLKTTEISKAVVESLEKSNHKNVATFLHHYVYKAVECRLMAIYRLTEDNYTVRQAVLKYLQENKDLVRRIF